MWLHTALIQSTNLRYHHKHHYFCVIQNSFPLVPVGIITVTYLCTCRDYYSDLLVYLKGLLQWPTCAHVGIITVTYLCTCRDY